MPAVQFRSILFVLASPSKYDDSMVASEVPSKDLNCPLCLYLLHRPKMLVQCRHVFCHSCIAHWFCIYQNCPLCRLPCRLADIVDAPVETSTLINQILIKCKHQTCSFKDSMSNIEKHNLYCPHNPDNQRQDTPTRSNNAYVPLLSEPRNLFQQFSRHITFTDNNNNNDTELEFEANDYNYSQRNTANNNYNDNASSSSSDFSNSSNNTYLSSSNSSNNTYLSTSNSSSDTSSSHVESANEISSTNSSNSNGNDYTDTNNNNSNNNPSNNNFSNNCSNSLLGSFPPPSNPSMPSLTPFSNSYNNRGYSSSSYISSINTYNSNLYNNSFRNCTSNRNHPYNNLPPLNNFFNFNTTNNNGRFVAPSVVNNYSLRHHNNASRLHHFNNNHFNNRHISGFNLFFNPPNNNHLNNNPSNNNLSNNNPSDSNLPNNNLPSNNHPNNNFSNNNHPNNNPSNNNLPNNNFPNNNPPNFFNLPTTNSSTTFNNNSFSNTTTSINTTITTTTTTSTNNNSATNNTNNNNTTINSSYNIPTTNNNTTTNSSYNTPTPNNDTTINSSFNTTTNNNTTINSSYNTTTNSSSSHYNDSSNSDNYNTDTYSSYMFPTNSTHLPRHTAFKIYNRTLNKCTTTLFMGNEWLRLKRGPTSYLSWHRVKDFWKAVNLQLNSAYNGLNEQLGFIRDEKARWWTCVRMTRRLLSKWEWKIRRENRTLGTRLRFTPEENALGFIALKGTFWLKGMV